MSALLRVKPWKLLFAILTAAAFCRLWGIAFGLPYDGITYDALTIEEIQEVHRALMLGAGEHSSVFGKGGLYLILFVEYGVYFVVAKLLGWVHSTREFAVHILQDRTATYVIGRVTVAAMGVATCYVAYQIARRLYDERVALSAALIGALAYFHAMSSAVVNVDIGATLGLWLSVLVYLRYEETGRTWLLATSGALVAVATAFKTPGMLAMPLLWSAIATAPKDGPTTGHPIRNCVIVLAAMAAVLTIIAPEWIFSVGNIVRVNFASIIRSAHAAVDQSDLAADIKSITVMPEGWKTGYLRHLVSPYNIALTVTALAAGISGALRKNRWDAILLGTILIFVVVMSLSNRTQPERYLLPIVPALWILGGRGVVALGKYGNRLPAIALALVVVAPAFWLVRAGVEKTHQDTRILAKDWIEANVPAGSKILMDGMRYRFSQSPPINPDHSTVSEKVGRAEAEDGNIGRGVSSLALSVYEEAMNSAQGPKYRIVSTVHGLQVKDLDFYVSNCFDYVITSSMIAGRFGAGGLATRLFPDSARFYESLDKDSRSHLLHEESAIHWRKSGPTIRIFKLKNSCRAH